MASLILEAPREGSRHQAGGSLTLRALAYDPEGYANRVEFFAGDKSIGVSEIQFVQKPDDGSLIRHEFAWKDLPSGTHKLIARAASSSGASLVSEAVTVIVVGDLDRVVLAVEAADAVAAEPGTACRPTPRCSWCVAPRGPKSVAVPVFYSVGGQAQNGVDYVRLTGRAELGRNQEKVEIVVRPLADRLVEGDEKVGFKLELRLRRDLPAALDCYRIADTGEASAVIRDSVAAVASITITAPAAGAAFPEGTTIPIRATAVDPKGYISRVEFRADGRRIGVSELTFIRAPDPGSQSSIASTGWGPGWGHTS